MILEPEKQKEVEEKRKYRDSILGMKWHYHTYKYESIAVKVNGPLLHDLVFTASYYTRARA